MVQSYNLRDTNLFRPLKVGDVTLLNRVALAPMTRNRSDEDFVPNELASIYYSQRSKRPGTLVISEGTIISFEPAGMFVPPGVFTPKQLKAWEGVLKAVHANGSFMFIQICALGGLADPAKLASKGLKFAAPSDDVYIDAQQEQFAKESGNLAHGVTTAEIKGLVNDFVTSAKNLVEIGADGVEIHGANGFLLFEFLYNSLNRRTDEYGGSIENRARLILEVIDKVGEAIGYSKVSLRLSPYYIHGDRDFFEPSTIAVYSYLVSELESRRLQGKEIAYLHIIEPRTQDNFEDNNWILQIYKGVIIRAGNYTDDHEKAARDVDSYDKTVIAYGRIFISNPDLANRLENDLPLHKYDRDTFFTPGPTGYIDYPDYKTESN